MLTETSLQTKKPKRKGNFVDYCALQ